MRSLLALLSLTAACNSIPVGATCVLVRTDQSGKAIPLTESEVSEPAVYVSFGSPDCVAGSFCMLTPNTPKPIGRAPNDPAVGFCSAPCSGIGSSCPNKIRPLTCQSVWLDPATLRGACQSDPGSDLCAATAGLHSPDLCAP